MNDQLLEAYTVHDNLIKYFAPHNNLQLTNDLDYDKIKNDMSQRHYFVINAKDKDGKSVVFLYLDAVIKPNDYFNLLNPYKYADKIYLLVPSIHYNSAKCNKVKNCDNIIVCIKEIFMTNLLNNDFVPKHEIVTDDIPLLNELYTRKKDLSLIKVTDPACIWIGAKVDQIIKITRDSEITCQSIAYRLVVPDTE